MCKNSIITDKILETQLIEKSMNKLIERYIDRCLYGDDYYKPLKLTLKEINKKELERERKCDFLL